MIQIKTARVSVHLALAASLFCAGVNLAGQSVTAWEKTPNPLKDFDGAIDRALSNERELVRRLQDREPVVETYIQEMKVDSDLGFVPRNDYYFLGQINLKLGSLNKSFLPGPSRLKTIPRSFSALFSTQYTPRGFVDEMFIGLTDFDRDHYEFEYVRREFLGDVRCVVIDVHPMKIAGKRRFEGRIWIEDRGFNIVRFNGSYLPSALHEFSHFDSWRINAAGMWLPAFIYSQDEGSKSTLVHSPPMRAQTRLWSYQKIGERRDQEFTTMTVESADGVKDSSGQATENSPFQSFKMWEEQASQNVVDRLQKSGLVAPSGEVNQVLDTVINNLLIGSKINLGFPVRSRVLLTTPLESVAVNRTILISRGLIDVLPDEASLAAVLAHELAHVVLGHAIDTKYAFEDRLLFDDPAIMKKVQIARGHDEERAADEKAVELLRNSPYKDNLPKIGLFLRMLAARSEDVPHLIRPLFGNRVADGRNDLRLAELMEQSPELKMRDKDQISALPLGSRIRMDPWSDQLYLMKTQTVALLTAKDKMPFQITPFMLHLTREDSNSTGSLTAPAANVGP